MSDLNRVTLMGRLTRDPEIKTAAGVLVLRFSIAVNTTRKVEGSYQQQGNFIECVAFGKTGETISKHFSKGQRIVIDGQLRQSTWTHENKKYSRLDVVVEKFHFVEKKTQVVSVVPDDIPF